MINQVLTLFSTVETTKNNAKLVQRQSKPSDSYKINDINDIISEVAKKNRDKIGTHLKEEDEKIIREAL